jgi:hypothetical protein
MNPARATTCCPTCGNPIPAHGRTPLEALAVREVFEERFRAAVDAEKERIRNRKRRFPWRVTITRI